MAMQKNFFPQKIDFNPLLQKHPEIVRFRGVLCLEVWDTHYTVDSFRLIAGPALEYLSMVNLVPADESRAVLDRPNGIREPALWAVHADAQTLAVVEDACPDRTFALKP